MQNIPSQKSIFLDIVHNLWPLTPSKTSDFDFVAVIVLTYHRFRNLRQTNVKVSSIDDLSSIRFSHSSCNSIAVLPYCELNLDSKGFVSPRLLQKFNKKTLPVGGIDFVFRVPNAFFYKFSKRISIFVCSLYV